ncbi:MAG: deoxynucleoside kinase [Burkholderiales bacterium]|nr:deoxynucleoside kinase [Burkholderiales bacterium]
MTRIEICGGVASGKTTLAKVLVPSPVQENFRDNPFWKAFYAEPLRWFEEKNFSFLVQHTAAIKAALEQAFVVCDYAVLQDLAYAKLGDRRNHFAMMRTLKAHLYGQLPPPTLIVHLRCTPEVQLQRIAARGRPEEAGITTNYLASLNAAIEELLDDVRQHTPVHTVDSDVVDFASDHLSAIALKQEVLSRAISCVP